MKKTLLLLVIMAFCWELKAQCPLNQAVDFTVNDVHGEEIHLFEILDRGQYVLIDFFFTTCNPCQQSTPIIAQSYELMGCNQHDVFYMEIDEGDSHNACLNWVNTYGIEYPTISGAGGGTSICMQYGIESYPTVILIAPNRSIVIKDLWPISSTQTIINALENQGLEQHDCGDTPTECEAPTPASFIASYSGLNEASLQWARVPEAQSYNIYRNETLVANVAETGYVDNGLDFLTEYCYTVTSVCGEGLESSPVGPSCVTPENVLFDSDTVHVVWDDNGYAPGVFNITNMTTAPLEILGYEFTDGFSVECQHNGSDITGLVIPSSESASVTLHVDAPVKTEFYGSLYLNTSFLEYQIPFVVEFNVGVDEAFQPIGIYPNPANNHLTVRGHKLGKVTVYDSLGQVIDKFEVDGTELDINTSQYANGLYFIKTHEQTKRFVVNH